MSASAPIDLLQRKLAGRKRAVRDEQFSVSFGTDDKKHLKLPPLPPHDDVVALGRWLTSVLALHTDHPIVRGTFHGVRGPDVRVVLERRGAPAIEIEAAKNLLSPKALKDELSFRRLPTDGPLHGFQGEHCQQIGQAVLMLCESTETITEDEETESIVGAYLADADCAVGQYTTYGKGPQMYEAAMALRRERDDYSNRPKGRPQYFIDSQTGEIVIAVSDLGSKAREMMGSLRRSWLDGRMSSIRWRRVIVDGHAQAGRAGRQGEHAKIHVYRGFLTSSDNVVVSPDPTERREGGAGSSRYGATSGPCQANSQ